MPISQPIRSKTKITRDLFARIFPHFFHSVVFVAIIRQSDYLVNNETQLKTTVIVFYFAF